jgi:glutamate racemase
MFDSGVGGLSVWQALASLLPEASYHYVADSAHCPYGARSADEIRPLSLGISRFLIEQGASLIVVACNTASAAALEYLRAAFRPRLSSAWCPPSSRPPVPRTAAWVGVLATPTTFGGQLYHDVVAQFGADVRVISQVGEGLVEQVEAGDLDGPKTLALLRHCLAPLLDAGADTLVLGCTHYPFLIPAIRLIAGEAVQIMEPSEAVARQAMRLLGHEPHSNAAPALPAPTLFATTGPLGTFAAVLPRLASRAGPLQPLRWEAGRLGPAL